MHRWSILIIVQRDATQSSLFIILQVHSTCFGCQPHPSSGAHKTLTTASGTGHIFVQLLPSSVAKWPRWRAVAAQKKIWRLPEAVVTVWCTPDDGCGWDPKHVEWTCRIINRLLSVASRWTIINRKWVHSPCFALFASWQRISNPKRFHGHISLWSAAVESGVVEEFTKSPSVSFTERLTPRAPYFGVPRPIATDWDLFSLFLIKFRDTILKYATTTSVHMLCSSLSIDHFTTIRGSNTYRGKEFFSSPKHVGCYPADTLTNIGMSSVVMNEVFCIFFSFAPNRWQDSSSWIIGTVRIGPNYGRRR